MAKCKQIVIKHKKKTSFVVFHCPQKKIFHQANLQISNKQLKQDNQVK